MQTLALSLHDSINFETNPANVNMQTGLQEIVDAIDFETSSGFFPNLTDSLGLSFQGSLQAAVNHHL
jgi:hypothetical protein